MKHIFCSLLLLHTLAAAAQTRTGRDYAVFFYVTDFKPGWPRLPETKIEVETLKKELETNFNFTCRLVPNPTKQQMLDTIKRYNDRLTENDQVLFFFSTHGHFDAAGDRGYLIGKDGLFNDEYGNTWLNYDDLRTYLSRCKAKHVLLALDACHSGAFGIRTKSRPNPPDDETGTDCATKVSRAMKYTGRQYCTSGNKDAKTPAKSLFAARFLEALRKGGEGGVVRFDDLEYYLGKVDNPETESGTFGKHESAGDFVFVRKDVCAAETDDDGLIFIQGGTFEMGCTNQQKDCEGNEKPAHTVTLSDYYIGKYEVTQKLWRDIMGTEPSYFENCNQCPVERVSWENVQDFLEKLNAKYPGRNYRLPTEAEWEYAARERGRAVLFGNGKDILDPKEANFDGNWNPTSYSMEGLDRQKTTPVGSFTPNALGLYDMAGNVWEWCSDRYGSDYYKNSPATNPSGPAFNSFRVLRGGAWLDYPAVCRVASRFGLSPGVRYDFIGFRLARTK